MGMKLSELLLFHSMLLKITQIYSNLLDVIQNFTQIHSNLLSVTQNRAKSSKKMSDLYEYCVYL